MSDLPSSPPASAAPLKGTFADLGVRSLMASVARHRRLVFELARREITDSHAGQAAGAVWIVVHPIAMFVIYAFLFTAVFKVRIGDRGPTDYLVYLFAGLSPWLLTQDVLSRASNIMLANATIVKKVMFPAEALVAKSVLAGLKVQSALFLLVIIYIVTIRLNVPVTFLLLPILIVLHVLILWGLSLLLSIATPYFRDIAEFVRIFLLVNMYLIPVLYLPDMVPAGLRVLLVVNPFSHLVWCYQDVLYFAQISHPASWLVLAAFAVGATALGSYAFSRLKHHIPSVV